MVIKVFLSLLPDPNDALSAGHDCSQFLAKHLHQEVIELGSWNNEASINDAFLRVNRKYLKRLGHFSPFLRLQERFVKWIVRNCCADLASQRCHRELHDQVCVCGRQPRVLGKI